MTPIHAILVLIIRLWAAGMIITSIMMLPYYLLSNTPDAFNDSTAADIYGFALYAVHLLIGIFAWILAPKFAKLSYRKKDSSELSINVDADLLVVIGSFLIGMFYLAQYLPDLGVQAVMWFVDTNRAAADEVTGLGTLTASTVNVSNVVRDLLVVLVASWMAFRPSHLAHMFSGLRRAGLAKVEITSPDK